jgi:hypothetical protein
MSEQKVRETIPLWLAVAITVVLSIPFGVYLGKYNFPLWAAFIVWAEYFALGAKPSALALIYPAFSYGAIVTGASMFVTVLLAKAMDPNLALAISLFIFVAFIVYSMRWWKTLQVGSLPLFNGISMLLAIYFTGSYPAAGNALADPWIATAWTIVAGIFGGILGWFNVTITFPRKV